LSIIGGIAGIMRPLIRKPIALSLTALLLAGCAAMPADQGFAPVAREAQARGGHQVAWLRSDEVRQMAADLRGSLLADPLTVDTATRIALVNNRELQAIFAQVGIATANAVQAATPPNPVVDAAMKLPLEGGGVNLDFGVAFQFINLLFLPARSRVATAEAEAVRLRVTGQVLALAARTRMAFTDSQAATRTAELARDALALAEAGAETARVLRDAGNITSERLAQATQALARARLGLSEAEGGRIAAREQLNMAMGVSEDAWQLAGPLPDVPAAEPDMADLERRALDASLDVSAAKQDLVATGERNGLVRRTALLGDGETGVRAERNEGSWEVGPSLAVPLPLFDLGGARTAKARAQVQQAEDRYAASQVRVLSAAREAKAALDRARADVAQSRDDALPASRDAQRQATLNYNAMQTGIFNLLDSRAAAIDAERRHVAALAAYWSARARVDLLAQGGTTDMAAPVATAADTTDGAH
jgi:cobalt-zinc-cadmium efflux system outer membrane protein